ncbi:MAG: glutamate-1-semialdehyde 2,1-aminomutase [Nitrospirota bacterium]|nr:glutamate-1-semialdehyde 2,1-aminomutase [Nitrospirota bacterium]
MKTTQSRQLFNQARRYIPGGVNSPVRAFRSVGGCPLFIQRAQGAHVYDADGHRFLDYVQSWGPMILGHAHPAVIKGIQRAASEGTSYGAPTEKEIHLARMICEAFPSIDQVRLVSSGTEAVMSAIRVARGFTKRDGLLKFEGCYHGHADHLLVKAGSGVATLGIPDSPGVPASFAEHTLTAPYNDLKSVERIVKKHWRTLACIIVEPIAGNMGVVPPQKDFLNGLRSLTKKYGILLIFDEVISGFRVAYGGAQTLFGIAPDLTCLGKIIGGGLPVGAYGGSREIMQLIAPVGPVYQAGTLSGNPLAVTAGIVTLKKLQSKKVYPGLDRRAAQLAEGLGDAARKARVPFFQTRVGSLMGGFFTQKSVVDYMSAKTSDTGRYAKFFHKMLERDSYFAPSQFEAAFVSTAHTAADIDKTVKAAHQIFKAL